MTKHVQAPGETVNVLGERYIEPGQIWAHAYLPESTIEIVGLREDGEWTVANHGGSVTFLVPMNEEFLRENYCRVDGLNRIKKEAA